MTEADWYVCTDPNPLLEYLRGKVSERKLRLFACACCGRIWHLLDDERCRKAAEIAERYAEGRCTLSELTAAHDGAVDAIGEVCRRLSEVEADVYGLPAAKLNAMRAAGFAAREHPQPFSIEEGFEGSHTYAVFALSASQGGEDAIELCEARWQADLFRDLVGNPFFPQSVDPCWMTWNEGTIPKLADSIYADRAFDRMPILADALEEAGCRDADILAHCRQPGLHARGCWLVDLLTGRS